MMCTVHALWLHWGMPHTRTLGRTHARSHRTRRLLPLPRRSPSKICCRSAPVHGPTKAGLEITTGTQLRLWTGVLSSGVRQRGAATGAGRTWRWTRRKSKLGSRKQRGRPDRQTGIETRWPNGRRWRRQRSSGSATTAKVRVRQLQRRLGSQPPSAPPAVVSPRFLRVVQHQWCLRARCCWAGSFQCL